MNMGQLVNHLCELAFLTRSNIIYIQARTGNQAHHLTLNTVLELEAGDAREYDAGTDTERDRWQHEHHGDDVRVPGARGGEDENGKYTWHKFPTGHYVKFYDNL